MNLLSYSLIGLEGIEGEEILEELTSLRVGVLPIFFSSLHTSILLVNFLPFFAKKICFHSLTLICYILSQNKRDKCSYHFTETFNARDVFLPIFLNISVFDQVGYIYKEDFNIFSVDCYYLLISKNRDRVSITIPKIGIS